MRAVGIDAIPILLAALDDLTQTQAEYVYDEMSRIAFYPDDDSLSLDQKEAWWCQWTKRHGMQSDQDWALEYARALLDKLRTRPREIVLERDLLRLRTLLPGTTPSVGTDGESLYRAIVDRYGSNLSRSRFDPDVRALLPEGERAR
jgi:hypothetical protein